MSLAPLLHPHKHVPSVCESECVRGLRVCMWCSWVCHLSLAPLQHQRDEVPVVAPVLVVHLLDKPGNGVCERFVVENFGICDGDKPLHRRPHHVASLSCHPAHASNSGRRHTHSKVREDKARGGEGTLFTRHCPAHSA